MIPKGHDAVSIIGSVKKPLDMHTCRILTEPIKASMQQDY